MNKVARSIMWAMFYGFGMCAITIMIMHKTNKANLVRENDHGVNDRSINTFSRPAEVDLMKATFDKQPKTLAYWDMEIQKKNFPETMPNPDFIFHNKLPKSGSTTMNNILKVLSNKHNYDFIKLDVINMSTSQSDKLIKFVDEVKTDKFVFLKHHEYLDFTNYSREQPTYINVIREPISWFTSRYYFSRNGWERHQGCRIHCGITEEEKSMTIDECVEKGHKQCTKLSWKYIEFFCGINNPKCINPTTNELKKQAVEIAKYNILHNYYAVGILEQFEDTLNMFDRLMPTFYKDATDAWKSKFVQVKQGKTKTLNKKEMSEESKQYFRDGPLHYEIELYNFARKIFYERMKRLGIEPVALGN